MLFRSVCAPDTPETEASKLPAPADTVARPVSRVLVGDAATHRYHRADCPRAATIEAGSKVAFKSPADAFARGFFPCRTCDPDLPALLAELPELPPPPPPSAGPVQPRNLTELQRKQMYASLQALKGMLKGIGTRERPYEVLSDRYRIPVSSVRAVESEGDAARWPTE